MGFARAIYFAPAIQRHDMSGADNRPVFVAEQQPQCNWPRAAQVLLFRLYVFVKIPNLSKVKMGLLIQSDLLLRFAIWSSIFVLCSTALTNMRVIRDVAAAW
jgi:hypothetical protein